jgi:hypothetical protein
MNQRLASSVVLAVLSVALRAQPQPLTRSDIDAAITWGESGEARAYVLHHAQGATGTNRVIVGVVYTPFVRVALAAAATRAAGRTLSAYDMPPELVDPIVHIAFRWYCCDSIKGDTPLSFNPFAEPFDYRIAVPGDPPVVSTGVTVTPLWVRRDLSALAAIGGLPFRDTVLLAAYPLVALSGPSDFVIYRRVVGPDGHTITEERRGRITASDLRDWR